MNIFSNVSMGQSQLHILFALLMELKVFWKTKNLMQKISHTNFSDLGLGKEGFLRIWNSLIDLNQSILDMRVSMLTNWVTIVKAKERYSYFRRSKMAYKTENAYGFISLFHPWIIQGTNDWNYSGGFALQSLLHVYWLKNRSS